MAAITSVTGRAFALRGHDIDTDRIIPARFLKAVTFSGLEAHVFEDDRKALSAAGGRHPFDQPAHQGAHVLVVNENFGCGSSREHAPQALLRWGIRAVIGESFAEIFASNALAIGLVCAQMSGDDVERLMAAVDAHPAEPVSIDVGTGIVKAGVLHLTASFPASARHALLSGEWDATGLLLDDYVQVERTAARLLYSF